MAKAKSIKQTNSFEQVEATVEKYAVEYAGLKQIDKENEKTEADLKSKMCEFLNEYGIASESGAVAHSFTNYTISLEPRKSASMNEKRAEKLLKEKKLYEMATKIVIDPKAIEELHSEGLLSDEDVAEIVEEKTTNAFYVRKRQ